MNKRCQEPIQYSAGLTTGTIYYANGEAEYTGQVIIEPAGQMPTGRYLLFDASSNSYLIDYTTSIPDGSGDSWSGPNGTVKFHGENINAAVSYNVSIDALGNATVSFIDTLGRVVETDYPDGSFSQTYYSISGQSVNEPSDWEYWYGSTNHAAGYSLAWQPTGLSIPPGGSETVQIAERKTTDPIVPTFYIYDANGNLIDLYEPAVLDGNPADSTYNTYAWPHWHYTYDASGNETSQIDPNGNVTYYTYDENGNRTSETLPDSEKEFWTFDQYGRELTQTDFDGNISTYSYYTTYGNGAYAGEISQIVYTAAPNSGKQNQTVSYQYDNLGNQTSITTVLGSGSPSVTTNVYDAFGNLIESDTPEGDIHYVFDSATGEHTETWTGTSHSAATTDTIYGYNSLGQLTRVTDVESSGSYVTIYTYTADGELYTETLPDGVKTTYSYDSLGRLTGISSVNTANNQLVYSQSLTLNSDGSRATSAEVELLPDGSSQTIDSQWQYDADGQLTVESVSSSFTLASAETAPPDGLPLVIMVPQDYNVWGDPLSSDWGGGGSEGVPMVWDSDQDAYVSAPGLSTGDVINGYAQGMVLIPPIPSANLGGDGTDWTIFSGDGWGDLDDMTLSLSGTVFTPDNVMSNYGDANSPPLPFDASASYTDTYTYDLAGNRMSEVHTGDIGMRAQSISYHYNADNELMTQISSTEGETDNTYDGNGSLISSVQGSTTTTYQYDVRNRLISVSDNGGIAATYTYDNAGNRVMENADGTTMQYLIDGQNPTGYDQTLVVRTFVSSLPQTVRTGWYVIGNTVLGQRGTLAYPGATENNGWFLFDAQGQTKALLMTSGAGNEYFNYDAFGLALNFNPQSNYFWVNGTVSNVLSTDSVYDPYTNLLLNGDGARDRTPGSPDFMQRDPMEFAPGNFSNANLFLYVDGNPVNALDPSGHDLIGMLGTMAIQTMMFTAQVAPMISAALNAVTIASAVTFAESMVVLQLMQTGYLPADGAAYVQDIAKYTGIGFVAGLLGSDLIDGVIASTSAVTPRLAQDEAVDGEEAPALLPTNRPVALNSSINAEKDRDVTRLTQNGAMQVRVNQIQVNYVGGQVVEKGINRPDVQGVFGNGKPVYIEYDTNLNALIEHRDRILSNVPNATVILKWFDSNGNYTIVP